MTTFSASSSTRRHDGARCPTRTWPRAARTGRETDELGRDLDGVADPTQPHIAFAGMTTLVTTAVAAGGLCSSRRPIASRAAAYSFGASRTRATGDEPWADFCEEHAQTFYRAADRAVARDQVENASVTVRRVGQDCKTSDSRTTLRRGARLTIPAWEVWQSGLACEEQPLSNLRSLDTIAVEAGPEILGAGDYG